MEQEVGGIAALGIDWKIFLAQLVNFIIVFFLLNKFAFKPLLKVLEERRKKVEQSVKDADSIILEKEKLSHEIEEKLAVANKKAQEIIATSTKIAREDQAKIREEATKNATKLTEETQKQIESMKSTMKKELTQELAMLIVKTTEKVISEDIPTSSKDKIDKSIKNTINEL